VLCISRWSHGKGLEYLLDAIPHVAAVMPDVRFVLAGRKEDSWETDVASYVEKIDEKVRGLKDHIEVFGWIDEAQKASLCARAQVAVMPSEVEYFPYAILEPVAAGIPVVSSRIAGAREILEEGRHCLMYETTDSQHLAQHILTLLGNRALARQLADNAHKHVSTRYTWERISSLYKEMYVRILDTARIPCTLARKVSASESEYCN
jgi:glycosyltransferase involved in cell wall biosynthesis